MGYYCISSGVYTILGLCIYRKREGEGLLRAEQKKKGGEGGRGKYTVHFDFERPISLVESVNPIHVKQSEINKVNKIKQHNIK